MAGLASRDAANARPCVEASRADGPGASGADGHACLSKPYRSPDLLRGLEIVAEIVSTGTASPPFPRGFQVLPAATIEPREPPHG